MQEKSQQQKPDETAQPDTSETSPKETTEIPPEADATTPPPQPSADATEWQFRAEDGASGTTQEPTKSLDPVSWTASEFVEHHKGPGWYAILAGGAVLLSAVVYLLTKDIVPAGVVIIVAIVFGILASRKPRELAYRVDHDGIHMGDKLYPYVSFKSFAIVNENAIESIWLMPLKRFMPIITIYFDPADKDKIVEVLSSYLPHQDHQMDLIDRTMQRIGY